MGISPQRRAYIQAYQLKWIKQRREEWIRSNGPCKECGSYENLEVDHIIPEKKKLNATSVWTRKKSIREKELSKCQVLCKECHLKKTSEWYAKKRRHGTETMYRRGCRCRPCKSAVNDRINEWRWRTGRRKKKD